MANTDLQDFERSLRQLENIADATTPTKRKPQTRDQESRQALQDELGRGFMPNPDGVRQLLTER